MRFSASLSRGSWRYQTLVGDQTLSFPGSPWVRLETLFGADAHAFDNSENPGNPFVPGNGSALHVDQAQVLSCDGDMIALNGRIHQISEPLREPASDIFSLLSSTPELSGWADWVQLTGLAELLADPSAGPFTIFAPIDSALELIPGRMVIAADTESLLPLLQFHVALGTRGAAVAPGGEEEGPVEAAAAAAAAAAVSNGGGGGGFWGRFGRGGGGGGSGGGAAAGVGGGGGGRGGGGGGGVGGGGGGGAGEHEEGVKLFTPSLANATLEERSVFSGERFVSGRELWTLLGDDAGTLSVQIAAADAPAAASVDGSGGSGGGGGSGSGSDSGGDRNSGDGAGGAGFRVFLGVGRRRAEGEGRGGVRRSIGGVGGLGDLSVGAFAAKVVLPDLNAVNGVVHGVAGVVTYPGYKRPAAGVEVEG